MTTVQAIKKAVNELGTDARCRDIWNRATEVLGHPIAKDDFFRGLDRAMDEIRGRTSAEGDPDAGEEVI